MKYLFRILFITPTLVLVFISFLIFNSKIEKINWLIQNTSYQINESYKNEIEKNILGTRIWSALLNQKISKLQNFNWIKLYSFKRQFPSQIEITIIPQRPIAYLWKEMAMPSYVLESGDVYSQKKHFLDLPILRGKEFENKAKRFEVVQILKKIEVENPYLNSQISEVVTINEVDMEFWLKNEQGKINLNSKNSLSNFGKIEKVVKYLQKKDLKARVIDSEYTQKVVVKLRNHR